MEQAKLEELVARQQAMIELAASLQGEKDPGRIQAVAERLRELGAELQALALTFETHTPDAFTEVVLTEAQRKRIADETGVHLETLIVRDEGGVATRTMPITDPRLIEYHALQEARRRQIGAEADARLRAELDASLAAIERQGTPAVRDQLDALKRDPNFLGGLLHKK